ncbi:MAG: phenylacetate--CoA ligase [Clostridiales bacterium]|jgi:phenylacetate-CoA ligase|nr:phenylacetate--CoA ligase [Clostridiales bacterium]
MSDKIWNESIELGSRDYIRSIQLERLKATVAHAGGVRFYRERLDSDVIHTPDDLRKLPFTTKSDLRDNYPFGFFAVPKERVVRVHASSGTTGKPTVVGYTAADLDSWSECVARIITMAGVTERDTAQISFGYGLFTGALGLHYGLERVGAAVIPISSGNTAKQLMIMRDFGVTTLIATPSYAIHLGDALAEHGMSKDDLTLKYGLLGAEGHTLSMNAEIEGKLGVLALENYGLSEVGGPGVSGECPCKRGMHINEDNFICEIIDPDTLEVLPPGAEGELVITTINKECMPLLRYRTRDISRLIPERCECGRASLRMAKVKGRTDDMLIIKGVNVYPSQVESVVIGMEHISPYYQLVVTKKGRFDNLEVHVEVDDPALLERYSELEALERTLREKIHSVLGLDIRVVLREPKSIERTAGKAKRVLDLRGNGE